MSNAPGRRALRVLLVDDEPALLPILRRVVQRVRPEATVVYASDPDVAVWQLRSTTMDLVITDMRMNGDERAGLRVVGAARDSGVPVAVLTGGDSNEPQCLRRAGVTVLRKTAAMTSGLSQLVEGAFAGRP